MGEDVRRGDVILKAGMRLGALELANLLACGVTNVEVVRPVRLAIISTGDEIVERPDQLEPGKIIDTNTPLLESLAKGHDLEVVSVARVADDRDGTARAIRAGVEAADVVALSGGISVGEFDYVHDALADLGIQEIFSGVAIKPGRPLTCARANSGTFVVALPGNPVSVHLMFHLCVLRIAALLSGADPELRELELELGARFTRRFTERQDYVPARVSEAGIATPVEFHGSAHLTALTRADGYLIVPIGPAELAAGSRVRFLPLGWT
jgi:molybdopterin molybdotransferase